MHLQLQLSKILPPQRILSRLKYSKTAATGLLLIERASKTDVVSVLAVIPTVNSILSNTNYQLHMHEVVCIVWNGKLRNITEIRSVSLGPFDDIKKLLGDLLADIYLALRLDTFYI